MLATDYSSLHWESFTDGKRARKFPKDPNHNFSVIGGLACFGSGGGHDGRSPSAGTEGAGAGGQVAISDTVRHTVVVFNPDGSLSHIVGEPGSGNGAFKGPRAVRTSAGGKLVVADSGNHRVQAFDHAGALFKSKWQVRGNGKYRV